MRCARASSAAGWLSMSHSCQWLACVFPYRRFADILADACARLGADVVRYSFIVVDLHHLLLADLPAHTWKNVSCDVGDARRFSAMTVEAVVDRLAHRS